jgi:hypothetical protein
MAKSKSDANGNMVMDRRATKMITAVLAVAQALGKVEKPKTNEKPKFRPAVHPRRAALPGEARELCTTYTFRSLCRAANIFPTRRQASKYIDKRGAAYAFEKRNPNWQAEQK